MTSVFLMTDVVGSTKMWEEAAAAMPEVLARHDEIVHGAVGAAGGTVFKHTGDGMIAVFDDPTDAVRAVIEAKNSLATADWTPFTTLQVRSSIHAGAATHRDGDYFGTAVNRVARINGVAHPDQILMSDTAHRLMSVPSGIDLGEHQLRDLGEPIRLWQLDDGEHPVLASLQADLHNLPVQLNEFVGRTTELGQLAMLLTEHRLVSITGVGGCGKTRLSLELAASVSDRFDGGVWFADLRSVDSPEQILQQIASAIGLLTGGEVDNADELAAMIAEYADKHPTLVILDNCEHVIDESADVAEDLLQRSLSLTLLATTREALGAEGERVWRIPSLSSDSGEAAALFMTRALAADSGFEVAEGDDAAIREICRGLDGIPLAIELAAARVGHLSVTELRDRLDERFSLLSGGRRARRQRQQTLQAMMDWSWDLLDPDEQQMLAELAVFRGGFDTRGVDEVCTAPAQGSRFDVLSSLVDRSLVSVATQGAASRYQLLETVRLYGLDRLTAGGTAAVVRDRHAEWVRGFSSCTTSWSFDLDELRYAELNVANLLAALEWFAEAGDITSVAEVASARATLWFTDHNVDGLRWLTRELLEHPDLPIGTRLAAHFAAGQVAMMAGDYDRSAAIANDGCRLADTGSLPDQAARSWAGMVNVAASILAEDHDTRIRQYARAVEFWPQAHDDADFFKVGAGIAALLDGDYENVLEITDGILDRGEHLWFAGIGVQLMLRSIALSERGRHHEALAVAERLISNEFVREAPVSTAVTQMAFVLQASGDTQRALDLIRHPPRLCVGKAVNHWRYGRALLLGIVLADDDPELSARLLGCGQPVRTITVGFRAGHLHRLLSERLGPAIDALLAAGARDGEDAVIDAAHTALRSRGLEP